MVKLVKSAGSNKISLKDWSLPEYSERVEKAFKNLVFRAAAEVVEVMFDEGTDGGWLQLSLPATYANTDGFGGPPPDDPLTIQLAWFCDSDDPYIREFKLRDVVTEALDLYGIGKASSMNYDEDALPILASLAAAFRDLATEIETAVAKCQPDNPPK